MSDHVVLYARVSSKEQEREGYSIDAQLRLLREYANREGFTILHEYVEVETAKRAGRPVFREMLEFLKVEEDCAVLVEKTDRLYRNLRDYVTIDEMGLTLHFVKEGAVIGPDARSHDRFIHDIKVVLAKNYVDNLSEETRKGMAEKLRVGGWPTLAPFGYKNVRGVVSVEPDPESARAVRWLYHRFAGGDISVRELTREFKRAGFKRRVVRAMIYKILRDPFYKGVMLWKGELYPGNHEPLIDGPTWDKVQALLNADSHLPLRDKGYVLTYKGALKCGHCGCAIVGERKKGKYIYYHCTENRGPCKQNGWIREADIDAVVVESLRALRLDRVDHRELMRTLTEMHSQAIRETKQGLVILEAQAHKLRERLTLLYEDRVNERIALPFWKDQHDRLASDLDETYQRIRQYQEADLSHFRLSGQLVEFVHKAERMFIGGDTVVRREIFNLVYSNCTLASGSLHCDYKKPFDVLAEGYPWQNGGGDWTRTSDAAGMSRVL